MDEKPHLVYETSTNLQAVDFAMSALVENQQENGDVQNENHWLASERQGVLATLANLQEDIEKDLFGKFKVVLNEKKAKIHQQLSNVSTQLNQLQQSVKQSSCKPAAPPTTDGMQRDREARILNALNDCLELKKLQFSVTFKDSF